jgi:CHAD domain-containing protein
MNFSRQPDKVMTGTTHDRLAEWRHLLENCGDKPTRKGVHALRVVTLRLQAEFEHDLEDLPRASHQAQAMLQFGRQAEKLRRALGPVRELDVWIGKLRDLRASLSQNGHYVPRSTHQNVRGIERLEVRLKGKRRSAEKKLVAEIEKRGSRFVETGEEIETALSDHLFGEESGIAEELVARFRTVRAEFPTLDEANLHEFRKRIKMVRYLAEMRGSSDPAIGQIATQMKKLQSAIGEWHDWQALAQVAHSGRHAKSKDLAELLQTIARESFETALSTANSITARMLGADAEQVEPSGVEDRKPPARGDLSPLADLNKKFA